MKSKDYEYNPSEEEYEISAKRKNELIEKVKSQVRKGFIAHHQILNIGKNDDELDFLYSWLDDNDIEIRGINGTISGEIPNYTHIPKMGQSFTPEELDDAEQEKLFFDLNNFSAEDKKNNVPEYKKTRDRLIEHNMKLAKWMTSWKGIAKLKIPLEDKYQMAYLGLVDAVDKFDPYLGYKFSTYACKAMFRRIIREAYKEDGEAKLNIVVNEQLSMIPDIENQILVNLGREAKPYEIADILGVSLKRVSELETLRKLQQKESLEQIEDDRKDIETISSTLLDGDRITESDDGYIMDGVYMDEEDTLPVGFRKRDRIADKAMTQLLKEDLGKALSTLTDRERNVLIQRFGLQDGRARTLEEVGINYSASRERIRQIEAKALRKLRHPSRSTHLKPYLEDIGENDDEYQI